MKTIVEDEWIAQFKPLPAPRQGSGYDFGNGCTLIDGHHPKDIEALEKAGDRRIWTVVDNGEATAITAGKHFVNRMGYIITQEEWDDEMTEVVLEDMEIGL